MIVNRSAPTATVVPILIYEDVGHAIGWLCGAFGFKERLRAAGPDGTVSHAQLAIAEGAVMLGRKGGEFCPPRLNEVTQYVHLTGEPFPIAPVEPREFMGRNHVDPAEAVQIFEDI